MKAFEFRLRRVLQLRESQLQHEEQKLEQLVNRGREIEALLAQLETSMQQARAMVCGEPFIYGSALASLDRFHGRVRRDRTDWTTRLAEHRQATERQRAAVVSARAKVRLLEKLREKQKADWQKRSDQELEQLAGDFSAAQWARASRQASPLNDQALTGSSNDNSRTAEPLPLSE
jgi:flagellar export protein FliJ